MPQSPSPIRFTVKVLSQFEKMPSCTRGRALETLVDALLLRIDRHFYPLAGGPNLYRLSAREFVYVVRRRGSQLTLHSVEQLFFHPIPLGEMPSDVPFFAYSCGDGDGMPLVHPTIDPERSDPQDEALPSRQVNKPVDLAESVHLAHMSIVQKYRNFLSGFPCNFERRVNDKKIYNFILEVVADKMANTGDVFIKKSFTHS